MSVEGGLRAFGLLVLTGLVLCGCSREPAASRNARGDATDVRMPRITVTGDDSVNAALNWQPPAVTLAPEGIADARRRAAQALEKDACTPAPTTRSRCTWPSAAWIRRTPPPARAWTRRWTACSNAANGC